jgi:RNA polymerase sigma-70 factor (ECF subfamily)
MQASEAQLKAWMIAGLGGDALAHETLLRALVPLLTSLPPPDARRGQRCRGSGTGNASISVHGSAPPMTATGPLPHGSMPLRATG